MIITLSGYKRSGKDTVADHLVNKHKFIKIAFADALKEAVETVFGINPEDKNDYNRVIWQKFGAACRSIAPDTFIDRVIDKINSHMARKSPLMPNFVISDTRMYNELQIMDQMFDDVYNWRIHRMSLVMTDWDVSEVDHLKWEHWDYLFVNEETKIVKLLDEVDSVVEGYSNAKAL